MSAQWKPITHVPGNFYISSHGECWKGPSTVWQVRDYGSHTTTVEWTKPARFMTPSLQTGGYVQYSLGSEGDEVHALAHRLVMKYFGPEPPQDPIHVNHIDGNRTNNRISNLEWLTPSENQFHGRLKQALENKGEAEVREQLNTWVQALT